MAERRTTRVRAALLGAIALAAVTAATTSPAPAAPAPEPPGQSAQATQAARAARAAKPLDLTHAVRTNFPDPGFLVVPSGGGNKAYYLYATGGGFRVQSASSPRGPFTDRGPAIAPYDAATSWENNGKRHRWAPHVFRAGSRYVMWYTGTPKGGVTSTKDGPRFHDCIGVAVADRPVPVAGQPATRFQPAARPIICGKNNSKVEQTLIDPAHYTQGGKHYLLYKRRTFPATFHIMALEMNADGLTRKAGAKPFVVLRSPDGKIIEAPSLVRRGTTLWLFTSRFNYADCSYRTEVFKAQRLRGPWKSTGLMRLRPDVPSTRFCGPGGAEVVKDGRVYRIAFHAWKRNGKPFEERTVWTGTLEWSSGRPRVTTK